MLVFIQEHSSFDVQAALMSPEDLEQLDSDSIIPPQPENARHSYVPFIQVSSVKSCFVITRLLELAVVVTQQAKYFKSPLCTATPCCGMTAILGASLSSL